MDEYGVMGILSDGLTKEEIDHLTFDTIAGNEVIIRGKDEIIGTDYELMAARPVGEGYGVTWDRENRYDQFRPVPGFHVTVPREKEAIIAAAYAVILASDHYLTGQENLKHHLADELEEMGTPYSID